ncbi:MAG: hypothetical protein RL318_452 [Fibrobacterota bacterium]|jgi:TolB protein
MFLKSVLRNSLILTISVLLHGTVAQEDFVLRSQAGNVDITRLSILPFEGVDALSEFGEQARPEEVLRSDLAFSGRFEIVPVEGKADSVFFHRNGVTTLIKGAARHLAGGEIEVRYQLLDAISRQPLTEKIYTGKARDLRRLSHRFSDDAVFQIYGERGIASTRIAFVKGKPGKKEIWAMDYDGFNAEAITKNGSINLAPTFDRDGALVWISFMGGNGAHAWKMAPGGKPKALINGLGGTHSSVTVSAMDGEIAIASSQSGQSQIYRANASGGGLVRLSYNEAIQTSPSWSPNGWELAFTSDRTGKPQIYIMDREGSSTRRLTLQGGYNDQASWSPNGDAIAFGRLAGDWQVVTIRPDGSNEQVVTNGRNPKWSPDGRHLVYMVEWAGKSDIWVCNPDGTGRRQLTHGGVASLPSWSP